MCSEDGRTLDRFASAELSLKKLKVTNTCRDMHEDRHMTE